MPRAKPIQDDTLSLRLQSLAEATLDRSLDAVSTGPFEDVMVELCAQLIASHELVQSHFRGQASAKADRYQSLLFIETILGPAYSGDDPAISQLKGRLQTLKDQMRNGYDPRYVKPPVSEEKIPGTLHAWMVRRAGDIGMHRQLETLQAAAKLLREAQEPLQESSGGHIPLNEDPSVEGLDCLDEDEAMKSRQVSSCPRNPGAMQALARQIGYEKARTRRKKNPGASLDRVPVIDRKIGVRSPVGRDGYGGPDKRRSDEGTVPGSDEDRESKPVRDRAVGPASTQPRRVAELTKTGWLPAGRILALVSVRYPDLNAAYATTKFVRDGITLGVFESRNFSDHSSAIRPGPFTEWWAAGRYQAYLAGSPESSPAA